MRFQVFWGVGGALGLALLAGLAGGCGPAEEECPYGVCSYPDMEETWCAREDHQCYAEDAPGYTP